MATVKTVKVVKVEKQKSESGKKASKPRQNSVQALQAFLKEPPALTPEEAKELDQIIQAAREHRLDPRRHFLRRVRRGGRGNGGRPSGNNSNQ